MDRDEERPLDPYYGRTSGSPLANSSAHMLVLLRSPWSGLMSH